MEDLKNDIQELKNMLNDSNLTREEKNMLRKLIILIKTNIKLSLLNNIISNKEEIETLITGIDKILSTYDSELNNAKDNITKGRLKSKIRRLTAIKKSIKENSYEYFVEDIVGDIKEEQQIINICSLTLSSDYRKFKTFFGSPIINDKTSDKGYSVNVDTIDTIFEIITNHDLNVHINSYVAVSNKERDLQKKIDKTTKKIALYKLCIENRDLIKNYIKKHIRVLIKREEFEPVKNRYQQNQQIIDAINESSLFDRLSQRYELEKRKIENEKLIEYLAKEKPLLSGLEKQESEAAKYLKDAGLESILEELKIKMTSVDGKISYKIVDASLDNIEYVSYTLFIETLKGINKCENEIELAEHLLNVLKTEKQKYAEKKTSIYNKMDERGKELVDNHLSDCVNIVELETSDKKYNISPILSAYVLRTISKIKKIDFDKLNDMIDEKLNIEDLKNEYNLLIERKIGETYHTVDEIKKETKPSIFNM